jgi:uncharacterized OB-fold protein
MPLFPVRRDQQSDRFFDGTASGLFLLIRDRTSGDFHAPGLDTSVDPSRWEYVPASGAARVVSWSVVHQRGADSQITRTVVGIVEFDEGPWWWTELTDADPTADLLGAEVTLDFVRVGKEKRDEMQPIFRVRTESHRGIHPDTGLST